MQSMIRFSIFGVQVCIHPTLWLTLAFLGGALMITSMVDLLCVLLFVVCAFVVLLAHEMGHALVGRFLGGGAPCIFLAWMGGDCTNESARLTRAQGVVMTLAGPFASLAVGVVATLGMGFYIGNMGTAFMFAERFALGQLPPEAVLNYPAMTMFLFFFLIEVSCWWTVLNMLPIFPLDGGQIMQGLMKSRVLMHSISLAAAVVMTVVAGVLGLWLLTVMMVLLAVLNYKLRQGDYPRETDFH